MLTVLFLISGLFITALLLRQLLLRRLCAICFSVAGSWLILWLLYRLDRWHDPVLLGLLMGQSIAALYYQLRPRLNKLMQIFTLPFFLTLTTGAYLLITWQWQLWALAILLIVWFAAYLILIVQQDRPSSVLAKVIDCCGR